MEIEHYSIWRRTLGSVNGVNSASNVSVPEYDDFDLSEHIQLHHSCHLPSNHSGKNKEIHKIQSNKSK